MKKLLTVIITILIVFFCFSCMTKKRANKLVSGFYKKRPKTTINTELPGFISSASGAICKDSVICKSRYKYFFTVPLVVYTYSKERIETTVNTKLYESEFLQELQSKLIFKKDSAITSKKLNIEFYKMPNKIFHDLSINFIAIPVVFYVFSWHFKNEKVFYPASKVVINYKYNLNGADVIVKTKEVNITNYFLPRKGIDTRKEIYTTILTSYDNEVTTALKKISDEVANEINAVTYNK